MTGLIATAAVDVDASRERVWDALTDPAQISAYMDGSQVETDWVVGSPIVWRGEYEGRSYEDKGEVLAFDPPQRLSVTHYSPLAGEEDAPENYHTLVYSLSEADGGGTHLEFTQDGCDSAEQAEQFSKNWQQMLDGMKESVE